jgi:membrane-associated phospholipid phosphatase
VLLGVAIAVGVAHVAAHVHHPVDVVAAMALAVAAALIGRPLALLAVRRLALAQRSATEGPA